MKGKNPKVALCSKSKIFKTSLIGTFPSQNFRVPEGQDPERSPSWWGCTSVPPQLCVSAPSLLRVQPGSESGWKFTVCKVSLYPVRLWELAPCPGELGTGKMAAALTKLGFGFRGTDLSHLPAIMALSLFYWADLKVSISSMESRKHFKTNMKSPWINLNGQMPVPWYGHNHRAIL